MVAAVRCAPPQNKPSVAERDACAPWLTAELGLVADDLRVDRLPRPLRLAGDLAAAGRGGIRACPGPGRRSATAPRPWCPAPAGRTAHGGRGRGRAVLVIGCYHPSQQNTFTGRVTDVMLDDVFRRARRLHAGL